jgi:hypothetical protein
MTFLLLTGAGFSRNWGGWLASEAFEYLLGCPEVDDRLRARLWASKMVGGGFEDALAALQRTHHGQRDEGTRQMLSNLQSAIQGMFDSMNAGFRRRRFHPSDLPGQWSIFRFLERFDCIFTLNQDLLLEALSSAQVHLMVIGYSFNDRHINDVILQASEDGNLKLFIVDPLGVDVLDRKNPAQAIPGRQGVLAERLNPHVLGASRRDFIESFRSDPVELSKIMRFFN